MADMLEAMGFPANWCEHALRRCSRLEEAVELLLNWQSSGPPVELCSDRNKQQIDPLPIVEIRDDVITPQQSSSSNIGAGQIASTVESADAVVPDPLVEERKRRMAVMMQAKKEKEAEKHRIRKQLQEDMDYRKYRQTLVVPSASNQDVLSEKSRESEVVHLQIRYPGHETMKGTFLARSTLKEVRSFVENELQKKSYSLSSVDSKNASRCAIPRKLNDESIDHTEALQAAHRHYVKHTNHIIAQAKSVRNLQLSESSSQQQAMQTIYFLVPFPRREFFAECSLETTLAEAQLVPRGTLTVQLKPYQEMPQMPDSVPASPSLPLPNQNRDGRLSLQDVALDEIVESENKSSQKLREHALKAAAKRMAEAATYFRDGFASEDREGLPAHTGPQSPNQASSHSHSRNWKLNNSADSDESSSSNTSGTMIDTVRLQARSAAEIRLQSSSHQQSQQFQVPEVVPNIAARDHVPSKVTKSCAKIPSTSRLLSRPEKLQRTSDEMLSTCSLSLARPQCTNTSSFDLERMQIDFSTVDNARSASEMCNELSNSGRKARKEEQINDVQNGAGPSCRQQMPHLSCLRIHLESGDIVQHSFTPNTTLQLVLQSIVMDREDPSLYGLVIPFPSPHFIAGEALAATLEDVGLANGGTVHLSKISARGMVTQGRRRPHRYRSPFWPSNLYDEETDELESDGLYNPSYEDLINLQESVGRVHVGVPEEVISVLPTHVMKAQSDSNEAEMCIICMAEFLGGEHAMSLPCLHMFHSECIRKWLHVSRSCPTCKNQVVP